MIADWQRPENDFWNLQLVTPGTQSVSKVYSKAYELIIMFPRFPHLLGFGVLTPQYAASKIVDAIEKNQTLLMMPRGAYFSKALQQ